MFVSNISVSVSVPLSVLGKADVVDITPLDAWVGLHVCVCLSTGVDDRGVCANPPPPHTFTHRDDAFLSPLSSEVQILSGCVLIFQFGS